MNTTQNNRLIAEFLGWKLGHPELLELRWGNEWFNESERKTNKGLLHFDTDWNQLMEVVNKIGKLPNFLYPNGMLKWLVVVKIEIGNDCVKIVDSYSNDGYSEEGFTTTQYEGTLLENVYNACLEFIKFYNNQKL